MTRKYLLAAALAAGLALPAFAADAPAVHQLFTPEQARQHLLHLGYTNVSELQKDTHGNWAGTATKDGKTMGVVVGVKGPLPTTR
jgi:opacity protein-like surface antigen